MNKRFKNEKANVIIDIKSYEYKYQRYLINLATFLEFNDFTVYLKFRWSYFCYFHYYHLLMAKRLKTKIILFRKKNSYYLSSNIANDKDICLKLYDDSHKNISEDGFIVPVSMHPNVYLKYGSFEKIPKYQKEVSDKNFRLVFAGGINKSTYNTFQFYGTTYLSRFRLMTILEEKFKDFIFIPQSYDEYILNKHKFQICIIKRDIFSLSTEDYFDLLGDSFFSICPPGIRKPFCHNLVEAMHNSSIPLLQYGYLWNPPLINNFNSIHYDSEESFTESVETILSMRESDVIDITQNVINYYNSYFNPKSVIKNLDTYLRKGGKNVFLYGGDKD